MKAVLLAGGEGTRLRPLTLTRPKPLVPVANEPVIAHVLRSLARGGVTDAIVTLCYRGEDVTRALGASLAGVDLLYSIEDAPRGTAGAVRKVARFLDGTFIVASGDVFADVDVQALVAFHRARGAVATMALTEVANPSEYGIVGLDDDGRIVRFKEKPTPEEAFSNLINAGIYVLEPEALAEVPETGSFDFSKDLFPRLLARGAPLYGARLAGRWVDIGRPADLLAANVERAELAGESLLAEGASLHPRAQLVSSAIGSDADVGEDAVVDASVLMAGARVDRKAHVLRSILGEGALVGEGAEVVDAILGDGAVVAPGALVKGERVAPGGRTAAGARVSPNA